MRVVLLASFVSTAAAFAVAVAVVVVVVGCVAVYEPMIFAVSSVSSAAVVTALGGDVVRVAALAFGADVLDAAVITEFTAIMFAFILDALSRHFFFWPRLPCPGPGMLSVKTK